MSSKLTDQPTAEAVAEKLRSLGHPVRLRILAFLASGERSVRQIEQGLDLRQPGLSQQLADLRQGGWVATRREAKSIFYRLADEHVLRIVSVIEALLAARTVDLDELVSSLIALPPAADRSASRPVEAAVFARAGQRAIRRT